MYIKKGVYRGKLKAVIFDWFGTIVDYSCFYPVECIKKVFRKKNINLTDNEIRKFMGLPLEAHMKEMCKTDRIFILWQELYNRPVENNDIKKLCEDIENEMIYSSGNKLKLIPGFVELFEKLKSRDLKIGTTSEFSPEFMKIAAEVIAEQGFIPDYIAASSLELKSRPYPWLCFENVINLGVYPLEAFIKVGDTIYDIYEGLNANMWTVGIINSGNEPGVTEEEINLLDQQILNEKNRNIKSIFSSEGAHYAIDRIENLVDVIDEVNMLLVSSSLPGT